jgi:hypothetical protein
MIFPSLRCPAARARPQGPLRPPAGLKFLRVLVRWRQDQPTASPKIEKLDVSGPRTERAADPTAEA